MKKGQWFMNDESNDETWCEAAEASVVCSGESYYRHHWKIDEFEV